MSIHPQQISPALAHEMANGGHQPGLQRFLVRELHALLAQVEESQAEVESGSRVVYVYFAYENGTLPQSVILGARELAGVELDDSIDSNKVEFLEHTNEPTLP
jgi:hypothetical protein